MPAAPARPPATGRQVWNKQRKDEVLADVQDVALGHETKLRWNDEQALIWSADIVQEPLVTDADFQRSRRRSPASGIDSPRPRPSNAARHPDQLHGLLLCGTRGRAR
jgi:hypothetical protein